jgi:2-polyprenyl-3-methyl-5-hydroxy-6-metoxy-1,4-benzoquinol methylase
MFYKLLKFFGYKLNFVTGDTLVMDRMIWLEKNLPKTNNSETLLDLGCGSGAITLGACKMGYRVTGVSWDELNQNKAEMRAASLGLTSQSNFPIGDARKLDQLFEKETFDIVLNFENIEHIVFDDKLFRDVYEILKPGGFLYLTTPYFNYRPMSSGDLGPFTNIEDGSHVRRGYTPAMLKELCEDTGFKLEKIGYCSFLGSQLSTQLMRLLQDKFSWLVGWLIILPLRPIAFFMEKYFPFGRGYSITLIAMKPRFPNKK